MDRQLPSSGSPQTSAPFLSVTSSIFSSSSSSTSDKFFSAVQRNAPSDSINAGFQRTPIRAQMGGFSGRNPFHRSGDSNGGSNNANWTRKLGMFAAGGGIGYGFGGGFWNPTYCAEKIPLGPSKAAKKGKRGPQKRVMILMSDTGGGHRASAQAIKQAFEYLYGDEYKIDIVDLWTEHTPWPYNGMPKQYSFLVKYPVLWRLSFNMMAPKFVHVPTLTFTSVMVARYVTEAFERYRPDLVISVHPLMQHVPIRVLKGMRERGEADIPFATVVTDLTTCHPTWFHPEVTRLFVPTETVRTNARKHGVPSDRITLHGLPIRPAFSLNMQPKAVLRKRLGMDLDKPAVLLVGGGEGMGAIEAQVNALARQIGAGMQLVVICGRNQKLVNKLQAATYPPGMKVIVNGFVDNMPDWMGACDMIITKAGPGTIAEALICGLPLLLNGFIPCQEEGNIPYVLENKVGIFSQDVEEIARTVREWLTTKRDEFAEMARRAKALGHPQATFNIVRDLAGLIREKVEGASPAAPTVFA